MRKYFTLITIITTILLFQSCAPTLVGLKGDYDSRKKVYYSDKSTDEVWSKIIELFSRNGNGIKIIDKSSGLIVAEQTDFVKSVTYEDENGKMYHPERFIVSTYQGLSGGEITPDVITGSWNVRLFEENGKTAFETNLTNIKAYKQDLPTKFSPGTLYTFTAKSTGVFEKQIADYIK